MVLEGDKNRKPCKLWAHTRTSRGMFERCGRCRWRARHQTGMAPHRGLSGHCIRFVFSVLFCLSCFFFYLWSFFLEVWTWHKTCSAVIQCHVWLVHESVGSKASTHVTKLKYLPVKSNPVYGVWGLEIIYGLYAHRLNHHICQANDTSQNRHLTECQLQPNSCEFNKLRHSGA